MAPFQFPTALKDFGYQFNSRGQLRSLDTGKTRSRAGTLAHRTPNALTSDGPLLLLIPGVNVSIGQWARSIIINDNINDGAIYSYLTEAKDRGYEVIVLNPNENGKGRKPIRGEIISDESSSGSLSGLIISKQKILVHSSMRNTFGKTLFVAKNISIVAHSYGGVSTLHLLKRFDREFRDRVKGIALTDAVHNASGLDKEQRAWLKGVAVNWITSDEPLDSPLEWSSVSDGCPCVSAGHTKHEYTTVTAKDSVFRHLDRLSA
ncbi:hypothetical protein BDZ88DRAFT_447716 [Geranomyces variabilis]|nr:hypothetical protein BDZ88DRAFT_447716 [Geranomyces variabilis]